LIGGGELVRYKSLSIYIMVATIALSSSTANASVHEQQNKKTVQLMLNLAQLQNLIKRDPDAYKEEFLMQKSKCMIKYTVINQNFRIVVLICFRT
jgi:hypothetical protein